MVYIHYLHTFVILINYSGLNSIPLLHSKIPIDLNGMIVAMEYRLLGTFFFFNIVKNFSNYRLLWSSGSYHIKSFCLTFSYDYEYK